MSKVLVFADIDLIIPNFIGYSCSVAIKRTRLKISLLKQVQEEIRNLIYRWWPEIHLIWLTPFDKHGSLRLIDTSGSASLRSFNSCCHFLREPLLLYTFGSRSQACRFRLKRSLWRHLLKGCVSRFSTCGSNSGTWTDRLTRSQNQGMFGHPGAIKIIR